MSNVLILGCGYTGDRVAKLLRARGCDVTATNRRTLDLEKSGAVEAIRRMIRPGGRVLHSVPTLPGGGDRAAIAAFEGAGRVVYLSSTAVYGDAESVDETTPAAPSSESGCARLCAENAVRSGNWSSLVLRSAAIYGPGRGLHTHMRGDPSNSVVSRIHVDDLAAHIEAALFSDVEGTWPVADEHPATAAEILEFLRSIGHQASSQVGGGPVRSRRRSNRRVDGSGIRRKLGIRLRYPSYREGIPASREQECCVFLAEDNPADVYLVREAFRQYGLGCHFDIRENGEAAVHYIRGIGKAGGKPPDVMMLDVNLPRIEQGEMLRECRKNPACTGIPLVVLSSADMEAELRGAGYLPPNSVFFRKPAELDAFLELGAVVKKLLGQA